MTLLHPVTPDEGIACDDSLMQSLFRQLECDVNNRLDAGKLACLNPNPTEVAQGSAKLVQTLVDFLHQLTERQAVRFTNIEVVSNLDIERTDDTFIRLEARILELRAVFGLPDDAINLISGSSDN